MILFPVFTQPLILSPNQWSKLLTDSGCRNEARLWFFHSLWFSVAVSLGYIFLDKNIQELFELWGFFNTLLIVAAISIVLSLPLACCRIFFSEHGWMKKIGKFIFLSFFVNFNIIIVLLLVVVLETSQTYLFHDNALNQSLVVFIFFIQVFSQAFYFFMLRKKKNTNTILLDDIILNIMVIMGVVLTLMLILYPNVSSLRQPSTMILNHFKMGGYKARLIVNRQGCQILSDTGLQMQSFEDGTCLSPEVYIIIHDKDEYIIQPTGISVNTFSISLQRQDVLSRRRLSSTKIDSNSVFMRKIVNNLVNYYRLQNFTLGFIQGDSKLIIRNYGQAPHQQLYDASSLLNAIWESGLMQTVMPTKNPTVRQDHLFTINHMPVKMIEPVNSVQNKIKAVSKSINYSQVLANIESMTGAAGFDIKSTSNHKGMKNISLSATPSAYLNWYAKLFQNDFAADAFIQAIKTNKLPSFHYKKLFHGLTSLDVYYTFAKTPHNTTMLMYIMPVHLALILHTNQATNLIAINGAMTKKLLLLFF